jgi:GNAT superfamily N-acetyltransferase
VAASFPIEAATAADLEALGRERVKQGWHPSLPLLSAILDWEQGGRVFVLREGAINPASATPVAPVATTSAIAAGLVGVVGNVVVREDYRRRGLGRVIMDAAVEWMRARGSHAALLDATPAGRPLYAGMGFVGVERSYYAWGLLRELDRPALRRLAAGHTAHRVPSSDLPRVATLDEQAFGGDRLPLIAGLLREPGAALYLARDAGSTPTGFLVARPVEVPRAGLRVGPWVAREPTTAAALLDAALGASEPWRDELPATHDDEWRIALNLPESSSDSHNLLRAIGVRVEVDDLIMRLDLTAQAFANTVGVGRTSLAILSPVSLPPLAAHPDWVYAWIAPMVF